MSCVQGRKIEKSINAVTYKTTVRSPKTEFEELVTAVKANNKRELMRLIDELHAKGMLSANERN